jgi:hypothetical protein
MRTASGAAISSMANEMTSAYRIDLYMFNQAANAD